MNMPRFLVLSWVVFYGDRVLSDRSFLSFVSPLVDRCVSGWQGWQKNSCIPYVSDWTCSSFSIVRSCCKVKQNSV